VVFLHLREHNLVLKHIKFSFGAKTVSYLGHIISEHGLAMDTEKVEALKS
jgi:hypothetical protein